MSRVGHANFANCNSSKLTPADGKRNLGSPPNRDATPAAGIRVTRDLKILRFCKRYSKLNPTTSPYLFKISSVGRKTDFYGSSPQEHHRAKKLSGFPFGRPVNQSISASLRAQRLLGGDPTSQELLHRSKTPRPVQSLARRNESRSEN